MAQLSTRRSPFLPQSCIPLLIRNSFIFPRRFSSLATPHSPLSSLTPVFPLLTRLFSLTPLFPLDRTNAGGTPLPKMPISADSYLRAFLLSPLATSRTFTQCGPTRYCRPWYLTGEKERNYVLPRERRLWRRRPGRKHAERCVPWEVTRLFVLPPQTNIDRPRNPWRERASAAHPRPVVERRFP